MRDLFNYQKCFFCVFTIYPILNEPGHPPNFSLVRPYFFNLELWMSIDKYLLYISRITLLQLFCTGHCLFSIISSFDKYLISSHKSLDKS